MNQPEYHALEYVDAYLHDALSQREKEQVAAHCEACPICRTALEEARRRQEAMQVLPPVEAPEALVQATLDRIARIPRDAETMDYVGVAGRGRRSNRAGCHAISTITIWPRPPTTSACWGRPSSWPGPRPRSACLLLDPRDAVAVVRRAGADRPDPSEPRQRGPAWPASRPTSSAAARSACNCPIGRRQATNSA